MAANENLHVHGGKRSNSKVWIREDDTLDISDTARGPLKSIREPSARVLSKGPWLICGYYLFVQPWTILLSTMQACLHDIVVWIHLPAIYKKMRSNTGRVTKINYNIDNATRGKLMGMVICVDLCSPLVSKIKIGNIQLVENEGLSNVRFEYSRYGHVKDVSFSD
ncbi:hypothetical protein CXB51_020127 [Gossypium anomalum]|uniref:DUF4283 domain-containing protein n=1 Tax=Gossypium anomalum TaxID=47600 RepID=A0A8J5YQB6_9ROSI|nr:hypothetical protein CXB51_020127 [Gossypium anomalum]